MLLQEATQHDQMTSIILEKLEETIDKYHAKLVIISDFEGLYIDKDIPTVESKEIFSQVSTFLSKLAQENRVIILATCPPHYYSRRNAFFHAITCARSNVTIAITKKSVYPFAQQFALEKHPIFKLGRTDFPSENLTINDFAKGVQ